ncbi:hypothetical protein D3C87_2071520 [compost metagenome]
MDYAFLRSIPGRDELAIPFGILGNRAVVDYVKELRVHRHSLLGFPDIKFFQGCKRLRRCGRQQKQ